MNQKENPIITTQPCYRKVIGNTTYVVRVHFSETAKESLEDNKRETYTPWSLCISDPYKSLHHL